jgi:hypothetical protein
LQQEISSQQQQQIIEKIIKNNTKIGKIIIAGRFLVVGDTVLST